MSLFWSGIVIIVAVRIGILTGRARDILENTNNRQGTIDHLHNVYFGTIALIECMGSFFLLRKLGLRSNFRTIRIRRIFDELDRIELFLFSSTVRRTFFT
jgi:hypothetical protein